MDNSYYTIGLKYYIDMAFSKICNERGWLIKSHRPLPWCPRCGTSLSEHEMSGSYKETEHLSIFAKLPIKEMDAKILVWTTTPWTLTSNVALAVNPEIDYVKVTVKYDDKHLIIGAKAIGALKGDIISVSEPFKGAELIGKTYKTCFEDFDCQGFEHTIIAWDEVDATEGTGVVHIAPGCGAEDFELGKKYGLPSICPINDEGIIVKGFDEFTGMKTTDLVDDVVDRLERECKLYKTEMYSHSYPYCWRCKTPVVFKLVDEWNLASDKIRPLMIKAIKTVTWDPESGGKRMLDWLTNMATGQLAEKDSMDYLTFIPASVDTLTS